MNQNLEVLLKYQELDIKLKRTFDALEKSDASKRMEQARNEFNNAKKTASDCAREAENVIADYKLCSAQLTTINEKIKECELTLENVEFNELGEFAQQLEELKDRVITLDKKLHDLKLLSEKLVKGYQDAGTIGNKMKNYFNSAKAAYTELKKNSEPTINSLKEQLRTLEPQIDEEILKNYKAITAENKYPAYVEVYLSDGTYSCTGCGLQLSQKNTSELNEKGICTCETCRRKIFKR